jgi:nucleoside-diphosphate-sugar epimerase
MKTALVGYTGFVGSNLDSQNQFDDKYNSSNIGDIDGKTYDLVVSAAARSEMWRINQDPEKDLAEVQSLIDHLKRIKTKNFVLISTVGVYKNPINVNEDTPISKDGLPPYGLNRYYLEQFCTGHFNTLIVRLPGLFGAGLKKNVIYDLLHNNNVDRIHHAGSYQYYNLANIWKDIQVALAHSLNLVNFATEPVRTNEVAKGCFGIEGFNNEPDGISPASFDMHTKYAEIFGGKGNYIYSKQQELNDIKTFIKREKHVLQV